MSTYCLYDARSALVGSRVQASPSQGTIRNRVSWTSASGLPPVALSTYACTLSAISEFGIQAPKNLAFGASAMAASVCFVSPVACR